MRKFLRDAWLTLKTWVRWVVGLAGEWLRSNGPQPQPQLPPPLGVLDGEGVFHYGLPGQPKTHADVFELDRKIRQHGNGDSWAEAIDVLRVVDAAEKMGPMLAETIRDANREKRREVHASLVALSRQVFGLPPVDASNGHGWSDTQAFVLFTDYIIQLGALGSEFLPLPKQLARPAA